MANAEDSDPHGEGALVPWTPGAAPVGIAESHQGQRLLQDGSVRSAMLQAGGFAGLIAFWNIAPLAAFGSFLFGVGGGAVLRLGRSDEAGRLDTTLRDGLERPRRAEKLLVHLAKRVSSPRMRFTARAWAALYAIERGDLEAAVAAYKQDDGWADAWRGRGLAPDAMAVPAILAWLVPTAIPPRSAPRREMIRTKRLNNAPLRTELLPSLLLMLEALEATAAVDRGFAIRAVQRIDASTTRQQFPRLSLLVRAHVGRFVPELRAEIEGELDEKDRAFLARVMPTYAHDGGGGIFRTQAETVTAVATLPPRAPIAVRERVEVAARERGRDRIARHLRVDRGLRGMMWSGFGAFLLSAALSSGAGAAASLGGILVASLSRRVNRRVGRSRTRVASLLGLEALTLPAWRNELDREFPTLIRKEHYDGSAGAAQAAGALAQETFVSCALAERALRQADFEELEHSIGWWFEGMSVEAIDPAVLRCCAGSLLRLAVFTGREEAAFALLVVAEQSAPRIWMRPLRGSIYGGSSSALAMARALIAARGGDWEAVAQVLARVRLRRSLAAWPRDKLVYARVAARAEAQGTSTPATPDVPATSEDEAWLAQVWPELAR